MNFTDDFEEYAGIYILTNVINGKRYVGETKNIKQRMRDYSYEGQRAINKAILKYGIENFEIEILYKPDFDKQSLLDLEEELIIKYNSLAPNGYNLCSRGINVTGVKLTPSQISQRKARLKENPPSQETRDKLSKANKGQKRSEEIKIKMSSSRGVSTYRGISYNKTHKTWRARVVDETGVSHYTKTFKTESDAIIAHDYLSLSFFDNSSRLLLPENYFDYKNGNIPHPKTYAELTSNRPRKYIYILKNKSKFYFRVFIKRNKFFIQKYFPDLSEALIFRNKFLVSLNIPIPD